MRIMKRLTLMAALAIATTRILAETPKSHDHGASEKATTATRNTQAHRPLGVTREEWQARETAAASVATESLAPLDDTAEGQEEPSFVKYESALTLVAMTTVIYAYGEDDGFELHMDERLDAFMQRSEEIGAPMNPFHKEMLQLLQKRAPDATVVDFISLEDEGDLQVGIACSEEQESLVVCFRGSESRSDWLQNAMVWQRPHGGDVDPRIKVHYGFVDQLAPAYNRIVALMRKHMALHPEFRVFITGHSLGGAVATLFGFRVAREWPEQAFEVVSFASPRVGNQPFVDAFDASPNLSLTRITNVGDIVTSIPMMGYTHAGNVVRLQKDRVKLYAQGGASGASYNGWWEFSLFRNFRIGPHMLDQHYEKMKRMPW